MFTHKLVAILNKEIEQGVATNALAHMSLGMGAFIGKESLQLCEYKDANGDIYPNISAMPFIILQGKHKDIRKTVHQARELQIPGSVFLNTMTGGTYIEQLERTCLSKEEELIYYGCVLFGEWDQVSALTKRYSLWR